MAEAVAEAAAVDVADRVVVENTDTSQNRAQKEQRVGNY